MHHPLKRALALTLDHQGEIAWSNQPAAPAIGWPEGGAGRAPSTLEGKVQHPSRIFPRDIPSVGRTGGPVVVWRVWPFGGEDE